MKKMNGEIDLVDYVKIIFHYRRIVLALVGASVVLTGFLSMSEPATYETTTIFFPIEVQHNLVLGKVALKPRLNIQDLVVSILESRRMADKVIDDLELKKVMGINNIKSLEDTLKSSVKINVDTSGLIRLSSRSNSAELAAKIANSYVENIDYFNKEFNIEPDYKIVEVMDKAIAPEKRTPRDTVKKVLMSGIYSFVVAMALIFSIEYFRRNNIVQRLRDTGKE